MKYILVANKKPIVLGRYGENEETTVRFSINTFFPDLADADFGLVHKRPGDAAPYPCVINTFNGFIEWEIKSGDLANVGSGTAQLSAYKGGTVSKTEIFTTIILDSMGLMDPPDPKEDWVDAVLRAGLLASDSADRALNYANEAKEIKDGIGEEVNSYLEEAKESGEFDGPEGPAGYSPYITVTQIVNGHRVEVVNQSGTDSFDVLDGAEGPEGPQGEEGYSPSVTIATIPGGHRVTITDADHPTGQIFDVMDGEGGSAAEVFWATYGTTTTAEIFAAYRAHKVIICKYNGRFYQLTRVYGESQFEFSYAYQDYIHTVVAYGTNSWIDSNYQLALKGDVDAKYTKPSGGIPASDLASAVQTSLGKADSALQSVPSTYRTAAAQDTIDSGKIDKPSSPASGAFLVWNGSAWVAQTLATWQGGSY